MELIVRREGREHTVTIEASGGIHLVRVDDREYRVDSAVAGLTVRSLLIDGRQVEVGVHRRRRGLYEVVGRHGCETVEVLEPLTLLAEKAHGEESGAGAGPVPAYMPGRVVELLVAEGESVSAGQGVLVLEAMKMENEIQAEREGTVRRFFVEPGQAVEGGDPLYELS